MKNAIVVFAALVAYAATGAAGGASNRVRYTYDAAGNVVAVSRVDPEPVSITGFAPASGAPGTLVAISGTGFSTSPAANAVRFNGVPATVVAATTAALSATVPAGATTGRIQVAVGAGTATSTQDFGVTAAGPAIPGIDPNDIVATASLVADGPAQTVGVFATNKYGVLWFDGRAGDWLSVHVGSFAVNPTGASIGYSVYKPDMTRLASGTLSAANLSVHVPQLGAAGRYALLLASGSAQVSLDATLESNRTVPADAPSLAVTRAAGQSTRALIAATAGEQKAMMVSAMDAVPAATNLDWSIALPNGSVYKRSTASGSGTTTLLPAFTVGGTHTLVLAPATPVSRSSYRLALLSGIPLAVDGPPTDVVVAGPGEGARLNFGATAGDNLGLGIARLTLGPSTESSTSFAVYRPDATQLAAGACRTDGTQCSLNLPALPTGAYAVIVQPANGATASMQAWLSRDAGGTLSPGSPFALALDRPGANARLSFAGSAGQTLRLSWAGVAISGTTAKATATIYAPNGATAGTTQIAPGVSGSYDIPALPLAGSYVVFVDPPGGATMSATLTLLSR